MSDTSDSLDAPGVSAPRNEHLEATSASDQMITARFATWNIFSAKNYDGRGRHFNKSGFVKSIRSVHADVIGLQEVDNGMVRTRWRNLARLAGRATGFAWQFGRVRRRFDLGLYGNALLAAPSVKVKDVQVVVLPRMARNEKRGALIADVDIQGVGWKVATTHLSNDKQESKQQLSWLLDAMESNEPTVVMGDLNRQEFEVDEVLVGRTGWIKSETPHTWSSTDPRRRIDWVLVRNATPVSADVRPLMVSDHCVVTVDVRASKKPPPKSK